MGEFSTTLTREKIIFADDNGNGLPVILRSNRLFMPVSGVRLVVRAQNMHTALRLAAQAFITAPAHMSHVAKHIDLTYEHKNNPDLWHTVHVDGKRIDGNPPTDLVDPVEACAALKTDNYDATIRMTEDYLRQSGRAFQIEHDTNVAATFTDNGQSMHCGIVHRVGNTHAIFSMTVSGGEAPQRVLHTLNAAADFLEIFGLQFAGRRLRGGLRDLAPAAALEQEKRLHTLETRQRHLAANLLAFEAAHVVRYRPDKPALGF